MSELGGDNPLVPFAPGGTSHHFFREMVPVALGCVNQIDAEIRGLSEHRINLGLLKSLAPFAAELPCADANDGYTHFCFAQLAIFHEIRSVLFILSIL
jgi:hypothetical protein